MASYLHAKIGECTYVPKYPETMFRKRQAIPLSFGGEPERGCFLFRNALAGFL